MDAGTLRIILLVLGVLLLVVLYFWERRRIDSEAGPAERRAERPADAQRLEPRFAGRVDDDAARVESAVNEGAASDNRRQNTAAAAPNLLEDEGSDEDGAARAGSRGFEEPERVGPRASSVEEVRAESAPPEEEGGLLVQLFVLARETDFDGLAVGAAAERHHLAPGEMDIYHRRNLDSSGGALFSMANLVNPGTFPFDRMDGFTTPGVALFAQLEGLPSDLMVYDELVQTARTMADELGGDLLLPNRRPFDDDAWEGLRIKLLSLINDRADALTSVDQLDRTGEPGANVGDAGNDSPTPSPRS
jgi:cell division protein ZipA